MKIGASLLLALSLSWTVHAVPTTFYVERITPELSVIGTFTLDVGSTPGRYDAIAFSGIAENQPWTEVYFDAQVGHHSYLWIRWAALTSSGTRGTGWEYTHEVLPGASAAEEWEALYPKLWPSVRRAADLPDTGPSPIVALGLIALVCAGGGRVRGTTSSTAHRRLPGLA